MKKIGFYTSKQISPEQLEIRKNISNKSFMVSKALYNGVIRFSKNVKFFKRFKPIFFKAGFHPLKVRLGT